MSSLDSGIPPGFGAYSALGWSAEGDVNKQGAMTVDSALGFTFDSEAVTTNSIAWDLSSGLSLNSSADSAIVFDSSLANTSNLSTPVSSNFFINNISIVQDLGGSGGSVSVFDEGTLIDNDAREIDFSGVDVSAVSSGQNRVDILVTPTDSDFLPVPDLFDEDSATFFYYGWTSVSGGWLIRRAVKATAIKDNATQTNNSSFANLTAAWPNRLTLVYA